MPLPLQLPPLNPNLAKPNPEVRPVDAPEATHNKERENFKGAMQEVDRSSSASEGGQAASANPDDASSDPAVAANPPGNSLPVDETNADSNLSLAEQRVTIDPTIKLLLGAGDLSAEQADDALLLATQFVVDSLPGGLREAASGGGVTGQTTLAKPEILLKLQAHLNQSALAPKMLDQTGLFSLDSLREASALKEAKLSTALSQVELTGVQSQQSTAAELKAATLLGTPKPELVVPNRVGSEGWNEAMAGRLSLLVNQRISAARIHINPPELGPIEVRVNLNNDQASVQFTSQSAQVRDALEQSIPRLREMLETAGFSLADSDVNDQGGRGGDGAEAEANDEHEEQNQISSTRRESLGLVDDYV